VEERRRDEVGEGKERGKRERVTGDKGEEREMGETK
jgi:hypothetical protein